MKKRMIVLFVLVGTMAVAQELPHSSAGARTSVDLTIYNQSLSLIREERTLSLLKGLSTIVIPEIPATIDGTSLHFASLTEPSAVKVLEQNYQYDLVNQSKILEKYIGKEIEFIRLNEETKKEYSVSGKLLSSGYGIVAEINGKVEINPAGRLVLPRLPEGLILRPQLEWLVSNAREGQHKTEISYMAGGISWTSNYVALLNKDDDRIDLTGWVTVSNNSGTTFENAGLKLVAGDVNLVREEMSGGRMMSKNAAYAADAAAPQFRQSEMFEYKLYSLQRRTDIRNSETKQIEFTSAVRVPAKKVFIYDGMADWRSYYNNYSYRSQGSFGQQSNGKVGVFVTFKNDEKSSLGMPLPKGKVRVYKKDDESKEQFVGEDEIDHTPKDEEIKLYLGNAFDIIGERVQKDFKSSAAGRVVEETVEIKLRNHKPSAVEVQVYEHPWRWSQWEITSASGEWVKADQTTMRFPVKLAKDEEKTVRYTIRYSW